MMKLNNVFLKLNLPNVLLLTFIVSLIIMIIVGCEQNPKTQNDGKTNESNITEISQMHDDAPANLENEPAELFAYEYDYENEGIRITSYSGTKIRVKIPDTIESIPVVSIGIKCFTVGEVVEIYCPETLRVFEWGGMKSEKFTEINKITIPYGVTKIAAETFKDCGSLKEVKIPSTVREIGMNAFRNCGSLKNVTLPDSVTKINDKAFIWCRALETIMIPYSITEIGSYALVGCSSLMNISVDDGNTVYADIDGVLSDKSKTTLIQFPGGREGAYSIPNGVTKIGTEAFAYCNMLTNVTVPNSVTKINDRAFIDCSSLTGINVDQGNAVYSDIDGVLFTKDETILMQFPQGNEMDTYEIPSTVREIGANAFRNCGSLTDVTLPDSVTKINDNAFVGCSSLSGGTKKRILQINPNASFK